MARGARGRKAAGQQHSEQKQQEQQQQQQEQKAAMASGDAAGDDSKGSGSAAFHLEPDGVTLTFNSPMLSPSFIRQQSLSDVDELNELPANNTSTHIRSTKFKLIAGSSSVALAQQVATMLGVQLAKVQLSKFNDGEISIKVADNVRNCHVYVVQSTCSSGTNSVNDNLMELFLLVRALKKADAKSVIAVVPYFGYARQDRKTKPRVPISASDVAMLLEMSGICQLLSVDLHCGQIQGFFRDIPVDNLYMSVVSSRYFATLNLNRPTVVSPDAGGVERAKKFLEYLGQMGVTANLAVIIKQRSAPGVVAQMDVVGEVKDRDCIIVDDMADTCGTLAAAAGQLMEHGAQRVYACVTHPVFSGRALENIGNSCITEMVVANTIPLRQAPPPNLRVLSVAPLLANAIFRNSIGQSLSILFDTQSPAYVPPS